MINLFNLLTYPVILLGLFRGSFQTYKSLSVVEDKEKQAQLEYWVVMSALLFLFPWIDSILGLFLFSGVVGCAKLGLLVMVVVSRSNYGFIYKLIEEQFIGFLQPYIEQALEYSQDFRTNLSDNTAFLCNTVNQTVIHLLTASMSDNALRKLKKRGNVLVSIIGRELKKRDENDNESDSGLMMGNGNGDANGVKPTSIFEQANSSGSSGWNGPSSSGLRKRNNATTADQTDI